LFADAVCALALVDTGLADTLSRAVEAALADKSDVIDLAIAIFILVVCTKLVARDGLALTFAPFAAFTALVTAFASTDIFGSLGACIAGLCEFFVATDLVVDLSIAIVVFAVADFGLWDDLFATSGVPLGILAELDTCFAFADALGSGGAGIGGASPSDRVGCVFDVIDFSVAVVIFSVAIFGAGLCGGFADAVAEGIASVHTILTSALFARITADFTEVGDVIDLAVAIIVDLIVAKLGFGDDFAVADRGPFALFAGLCS
jgi:hypothetical protein